MSALNKVGEYTLLMQKVLTRPDRFRETCKQIVREMNNLGVSSIIIVLIISFFIGAVITIQIRLRVDNPMLPKYTTGLVTRDILLLEFSSTIMCLLLAGKVGSNIASEIGTMRITEQIDALDIMGVNSANFLILPKIVGLVLFSPILVIFSMIIGISGGYMVSVFTDLITTDNYLYGLQTFFVPFYIKYSIIKTLVYSFLIASIAGYYGYYVKGGSLEVGKASTDSVVMSSITILIADLVLTQLLLT